jgi:N-acetylmuramoyl-L-alanine amidase
VRFVNSPSCFKAVLLAFLAALLGQSAPDVVWAEPAAAAPAKPVEATCDRAAFRVIVDVGHTLEASGARSARGVTEYQFNLALAKLIEQSLIDAGFGKTTLLVTNGPAMKSLFGRVAQANKSSADLLLSIHHDSVPDRLLEKWEFEGKARGFSDRFKGHSIFVSIENGDFKGSLGFAKLLGQQLKDRGLQYTRHYTDKIMGDRQRQLVDADAGVYRYDKLLVLQSTHMPAVLLEAGSVINRDEELVMGTPEHQALVTAAATDAVERFCASRRSRNPVAVERRLGVAPAAKPSPQPHAATQPANPPKLRWPPW